MNCLTDWIGIIGCTTITPGSGIYINSLPGISMESIDKIADADQITFQGVWDDVQLRALKRMDVDLSNQFRKKYKISKVKQSIDLLKLYDDTNDQTAADTDWRGFIAELTYKNLQKLVSSSFQVFQVQSFSIYLKAVALDGMGDPYPVTIKIFDLQSGLVLDSFSITAPVVGWNNVSVNKYYAAYRIFVAYDATNIESVKQDISQDLVNSFIGYSYSIFGRSGGMSVNGAKSAALSSLILDADITKGQNIYGLTSVINVQCRYDALVCNNKDSFTLALWYLLGEELMDERIYSNRINRYTTVDVKKAKELKELFNKKYTEALAECCDNIDLDTSDACLECHDQVTVKETAVW